MTSFIVHNPKKKAGGKKRLKKSIMYAQVHSVNMRAEYLFLLAALLTVCLEGL